MCFLATSTTANTLNLPVCYEQNQRYETKNTGYFSLKIFPKKYHGKCRVSKVRCSTRACLKIHFRHLHAPLCGRFGSHSVNVAHYASLIRTKSPTNCDAHLTESNFQTRSSISKDKIKWRQRDSNPRSLRCERSAFPAKLCPHNNIKHLIFYSLPLN